MYMYLHDCTHIALHPFLTRLFYKDSNHTKYKNVYAHIQGEPGSPGNNGTAGNPGSPGGIGEPGRKGLPGDEVCL